jgi:GH25 family lysozyme M1 (1,4-beta-N-acetylmuramidase)
MITIKMPFCADVSHWKEIPDFNAITPRPFLMITKATEDIFFKDDKFIRFFQGMEQIGCHRGAYHFFRRAFDPVKQAEHFCRVIYPHVLDDDLLFLDVEETGTTAAQMWAWLECVRGHYPRNIVMIYSSAQYLNPIPMTAGERAYFTKIPTWVAGYPTFPDYWDEPPLGYIPDRTKWGPVWMWQYSAHGAITGIHGDVDLNWLHPTLIDLLGEVTPPTEPGEPMTSRYEATSIYSMSLRPDHTTANTKIGTIAAQSRMQGDLLWDEVPGEKWLYVLSVNGVSMTQPGWVAIITASRVYCALTDTQPPTQELPNRFALSMDGVNFKWYVAE